MYSSHHIDPRTTWDSRKPKFGMSITVIGRKPSLSNAEIVCPRPSNIRELVRGVKKGFPMADIVFCSFLEISYENKLKKTFGTQKDVDKQHLDF